MRADRQVLMKRALFPAVRVLILDLLSRGPTFVLTSTNIEWAGTKLRCFGGRLSAHGKPPRWLARLGGHRPISSVTLPTLFRPGLVPGGKLKDVTATTQ